MVDVIGTYLELNEFLEPRGMEIIPDGIIFRVVNKHRDRTMFVADRIVEISEWVRDKYGEYIVVKTKEGEPDTFQKTLMEYFGRN